MRTYSLKHTLGDDTMALVKRYMTPKGESNYWVVALVQIDNFNKTAYVRLHGFISREHSDMEGTVPITSIEANLAPDLFHFYFDKSILALENITPLTQAYLIFKDFNIQNEQGNIFNFKDATDDIQGVD